MLLPDCDLSRDWYVVGVDDGCDQPREALVDFCAARSVLHFDAATFTTDQACLSEALKCCERVDLGIGLSLTFTKVVQFCEQFEPAISAKMATRTGSESAWRMPSTVTSSIEGWKRGRMLFILHSHGSLFNST